MKKVIGITSILLLIVIGIFLSFTIRNHNTDDSKLESNQDVTENDATNEEKTEDKNDHFLEEEEERLKIRVSDGSRTITFALNESEASKSLYEQLPLTTRVENFSSNEKIFYPTNELYVGDTPRTNDGDAGVLAYYEPWGDVVMFYDSFRSASGLYELGVTTEGMNQISHLSGEITIERLEN